jgi:hypothetical protein
MGMDGRVQEEGSATGTATAKDGAPSDSIAGEEAWTGTRGTMNTEAESGVESER